MYVDDLKADFFRFLSGKRIVLMIHYDIDSICACKIFQILFRNNHTPYTLITVRGIEDLKKSYQEHSEDVNYFVFINCGGTVDIVDVLEPKDEAVFFVLDSHRPTDLCNIFSNNQIRLLWKPEEDANVPDFNDIFREEDEDEEEDDDTNVEDAVESDENEDEPEIEGSAAKRRRLNEEAILKRRERRLWEEKRDKLLFEYSQFTYYNKASAIVLFDLAWSLNKDDKNLLWLAIVALTEQMLLGKIENTHYVLETGNLQSHVTRLQNRTNDTDVCTSLRITFEKDLKLPLYRHWSVESSLKYSSYTSCKLKLWSYRGHERLCELLADMGFPLVQSRQAFRSMDLQLRKEFHSSLEKVSEKYGLTDIAYASFTLQYGYRNKYCASDIVYALLAIIENYGRDKKPEECLHVALECLSRTNASVIIAAIESAKLFNISLFKTVQTVLNMNHVVSAGPFIYYIVQEGQEDCFTYSHPHILRLLAQFLLTGYVAASRNRKAANTPLIVSAPLDLERGTCVILGVPPLSENSPKSFFGKAFEQVFGETNFNYSCDYFDTSYVQIYTKDRTRFFDALAAIIG